MSESFAALSGGFPTCRNRSPRRREVFRHVGIIRYVAGKLFLKHIQELLFLFQDGKVLFWRSEHQAFDKIARFAGIFIVGLLFVGQLVFGDDLRTHLSKLL